MLRRLNRRGVLVAAVASIGLAFASFLMLTTPPTQSQPRKLDVPYVPTPEHIVEAMLRMAGVGPDDFLVDLGCGDGRIPIKAAKTWGTRGFGVDLNPQRIKEARTNAEKAGVTDKVAFVEGDLFKTDLGKASVLTLYLLPTVNMKLRQTILDMRPGTRVVSHAFHMEDWKADATEQFDFRSVYFWVVPAKVSGKWAGTLGGARIEIDLRQQFQELSGTATVDGQDATIATGKVSGEAVNLELGLAGGQPLKIAVRLTGGALVGDDLRLEKI